MLVAFVVVGQIYKYLMFQRLSVAEQITEIAGDPDYYMTEKYPINKKVDGYV